MSTRVEQRSRRMYSDVDKEVTRYNERVNKMVNEIFKLKYKVTTVPTYILVYGVK